MGSPLGCHVLVFLCLFLFLGSGTSLRVTSPESLKGSHETAKAKFGGRVYGAMAAGTVVYPSDNQNGCEDFHRLGLSSFHGKTPVFLLIDRGDCYFALKVWNAQKVGASAVLIADNSEKPLVAMDPPTAESAKYVHNITIPSVIVSKDFGDQVKMAIITGEMVNIKLDSKDEEEKIGIDVPICPCPHGCGCCC